MNFLNNWSFWAVFVASISVFLSQIPPKHQLIKGAKLDFDIYKRIVITHKIGNPQIQIYLLIANEGSRRVKVKEINAVIMRNDGEQINLPAQVFLTNRMTKNRSC